LLRLRAVEERRMPTAPKSAEDAISEGLIPPYQRRTASASCLSPNLIEYDLID
jgi:hypothetical protein